MRSTHQVVVRTLGDARVRLAANGDGCLLDSGGETDVVVQPQCQSEDVEPRTEIRGCRRCPDADLGMGQVAVFQWVAPVST